MRIFIDRCGSGWGGYEGKYLIDTEKHVIVDVLKSFYKIKAKVYLDDNKCIRLPLDSFPEEYIKEFNYDIYDLEYFLPTAEVMIDNTFCFDQQVDYVYYLHESGKVVCILDTSGNGENKFLENRQLADKLYKLMEVVSNA